LISEEANVKIARGIALDIAEGLLADDRSGDDCIIFRNGRHVITDEGMYRISAIVEAKMEPVRDALSALLLATDVNDGNYKQYAAAEEALAMLGES